MLQIVLFKRDLRVQDHEALTRAAQHGPVLPLYIVEPGLWEQPDASGRQWAFLREALASLRDRLAAIGQPLVVRHGEATDVLRHLIRTQAVAALWSHQETGNAWTYERDRAVAALMREHGIAWHQMRQHGVVRGGIDRDHWSRQWELLMTTPLFEPPTLSRLRDIDIGPLPEWPSDRLASDACPGRQPGGRASAEQALESFLSERGQRYHLEMSSPSIAMGSCSRLSAHLAVGAMSMRETLQRTRRRRSQVRHWPADRRSTWSRALAAYEGRLHWHCHFMQKLESEPAIEFSNLQHATRELRPTTPDAHKLAAWCNGETGWPLVDACLRALDHHGWINFRMRAMLTSVASYQLWLHWREPGLHLARRFVDYEPGIHWSQLQMQSGTTGINTLRIYNPVKQSRDQDPTGRFIRTWLPELRAVSDEWIHTPWRMPGSEQGRCGVRIGNHYPAPLVDHEAAARLARQRIQQARRGDEARRESRAIHNRHGSRKGAARRRQPSRRQADLFDNGA